MAPVDDSFYGQMYEFMGLTKEGLRNLRNDIDRILDMEEKCQDKMESKIGKVEKGFTKTISDLKTIDITNIRKIAEEAKKLAEEEKKQLELTRAKVVGWAMGAGFVFAILWKVGTELLKAAGVL